MSFKKFFAIPVVVVATLTTSTSTYADSSSADDLAGSAASVVFGYGTVSVVREAKNNKALQQETSQAEELAGQSKIRLEDKKRVLHAARAKPGMSSDKVYALKKEVSSTQASFDEALRNRNAYLSELRESDVRLRNRIGLAAASMLFLSGEIVTNGNLIGLTSAKINEARQKKLPSTGSRIVTQIEKDSGASAAK